MSRLYTELACHQQFSGENLDILRANPENFSRIITGDKTWAHHHDPDTKQESMEWKHKGSPTPKKCLQQSAGKIMATVFWDSGGVLLLEFMPHKTAITGDAYASTMVALCKNIK